MSVGGYTLAIEISNPSSGVRGELRAIPGDTGSPGEAGPGVALGRLGPTGLAEHLGTELLREGTRHDDDLMPAIDRLCGRLHARPSELGAIAVSIGPGGYTSLRIAVATAKMLAEATGARPVPVPSASVAAWRLPTALAPAVVCLASKGDSAYGVLLPAGLAEPEWWAVAGRRAAVEILPEAAMAALEGDLAAGKGWIAASAPLGMIFAAQIEALRPKTVIADRFLPASMRAAAAGVGALVVEPIFAAQSVLSIAAHSAPIDPPALSPLYAREAEAVTQWRKRKGGAG